MIASRSNSADRPARKSAESISLKPFGVRVKVRSHVPMAPVGNLPLISRSDDGPRRAGLNPVTSFMRWTILAARFEAWIESHAPIDE